MILLLGGTLEARIIYRQLLQEGFQVLATAVSNYGAELLDESTGSGSGTVCQGALDLASLHQLITFKKIRLVVDATHPFAKQVSENAMAACRVLQISYLRYERPQTRLPESSLLVRCKDFQAAARSAVDLCQNAGKENGTIFLTVGSKNLEFFTDEASKAGIKIVARVLPLPDVVQKCFDLGLSPAEIVAVQGPFSAELNKALFQEYQAAVVVTKESGAVGGLEAKIEAALNLELPVVMIERPCLDYGQIFCDPQSVVKACCSLRCDQDQ